MTDRAGHIRTPFVFSAACLLSAALFVLSAWFHLPLPLNHDAAWHLQTAFKWLGGARVGFEVFDINPPMTMWISALPALVCEATGMDPALAFKLFVYLVLLACLLLAAAIITRTPFAPAGHATIIVVSTFGLVLLPAYDFGQREHLAAAMTLPYVLLAAARASGAQIALPLALTAGLLAGIGIGIKPYFVALPLLVEIALVAMSMRLRLLFRTETMAIVLTGAVYLVCVWLFASGYLTEVLPAALSNYRGFNSPPAVMVQALSRPVAALAGIWLIARMSGLPWRTPSVLLPSAAAAAFMTAVILQMKGWGYQLYPVWFYLLVAAAAAAVAAPLRLLRLAPAALLLAYVGADKIAPSMTGMVAPGGTAERVGRLAEIFTEHAGPGKPVYAFITSPRDIHPAILESRSEWAGASGALIYLPAYLQALRAKTAPEDLDMLRDVAERYDHTLLGRLEHAHPGVIVMQTGNWRLALSDIDTTYPEYFSRYPRFVALWRDYEYLETVGSFEVFIRKR
jgi:hypothetical protein